MKSFFDYLYKNDLSPKKLESTISNWTSTKMIDFILNSQDFITYTNTR